MNLFLFDHASVIGALQRAQFLEQVGRSEVARYQPSSGIYASPEAAKAAVDRVAASTVDYTRAYWWQDPSIGLDLSKAGIPVSSQAAADVANTSSARALAQVASQDPAGNVALDAPTPRAWLGNFFDVAKEQANYVEAIRRMGADPAKYGIDPTRIQDFYANPGQFISQNDLKTEMAQVAYSRSYDRFGNRSPQVMGILRGLPFQMRTQIASDISDGELLALARQSGSLNDAGSFISRGFAAAGREISSGAKGASRVVSAGLYAPLQVTANAFLYAQKLQAENPKFFSGFDLLKNGGPPASSTTAGITNGILPSLAQPSSTPPSPSIAEGLKGIFTATDTGVLTTRPDLAGSGFFLSEAGVKERQRLERPISRYGTSGPSQGQRLTIGRTAALGVGADRWGGALAYTTLSGLVDLAVTLSDKNPGNIADIAALGSAGRIREARGVSAIPFIGKVNPIETGLLSSLWRDTVDIPTASTWLQSWRGRAVVDRLIGTNSIQDVMGSFKDRIPVWLARRITEINPKAIAREYGLRADSPVARAEAQRQMSGLLRSTIGDGTVGAVPHLSLTSLGTRLGGTKPLISRSPFLERLGAVTPSTIYIDSTNTDVVYQQSRRLMINGLIPRGDREVVLRKIAEAKLPTQRMDAFMQGEGLVAQKLFEQLAERETHSLAHIAKVGRFSFSKTSIMRRVKNLDVGERVNYLETMIPADKRKGLDLGELTTTQIADLVISHRPPQAVAQQQAQLITNQLIRHFRATTEDLSRYAVDNAGHNYSPWGVVGDNVVKAATPLYETQLLTTKIPMDGLNDIRRIRRIVSRENALGRVMGPLMTTTRGDLRIPAALLDWTTTILWKRLVLMKGSYILKVVPDEQGRMAATGGDSLLNNPMGYMAWLIGSGDHPRVAKLAGLTKLEGRNIDITGAAINDSMDFSKAIVGRDRSMWEVVREFFAQNRQGPSVDMAKTYSAVSKTEPTFVKAWANELGQISASTIARMLVSTSVDETAAVIAKTPRLMDQARQIAAIAEANFGRRINMDNPATMRTWLEGMLSDIRLKTGDSPDLLNVVATGKFGNPEDLQSAFHSGVPPLQSATDEFVASLADRTAIAPDWVKALKTVTVSGDVKHPGIRGLERFLSAISGLTIEVPTSRLNRGPMFRQMYWKSVLEDSRHMSSETAQALLGDMPTGLPRDMARSLKYRLGERARSADTVGLNLEAYDMLAKGRALDKTNELLVSMAEKQQWHDMVRVAAPFAQVWQEVIQTWGRIITANPKVLTRMEQVLTVMHDPNFADVVQQIPTMETVSGQGLMYTNDYGQEMVVIPWVPAAAQLMSRAVNDTLGKATGGVVHVPQRPSSLDGGATAYATPASLLSIGTSVVPGIGPYVAMPLAAFVNKLPGDWSSLMDRLFPFGDPPPFNVAGLARTTLPSWIRYGVGSVSKNNVFIGDKQELDGYNGKINGAMAWLLETGKYDLAVGGDATAAQLMADAKDIVAWGTLVAAMGTEVGFGPTRQDLFLTGPDGKVAVNPTQDGGTFLTTTVAANIYRTYVDEATAQGLDYKDAHNVAITRLIREVGAGNPQIMFTVLGKSKSTIPGGAPVSREAYKWLKADPSRESLAPTTWQFFAPQAEDFYYPMYLKTIGLEDRTRLTPKQWVSMAQDLEASYYYASVLERMTAPDGKVPPALLPELAKAKDYIQQTFPGWRADRIPKRKTLLATIDELNTVTSAGGKYADHPLAKPIQEILATRRTFREGLQAAGVAGIESAAKTEPLRQWYDRYLSEQQQKHPGLKGVITSVLRAEIAPGLAKDVERSTTP